MNLNSEPRECPDITLLLFCSGPFDIMSVFMAQIISLAFATFLFFVIIFSKTSVYLLVGLEFQYCSDQNIVDHLETGILIRLEYFCPDLVPVKLSNASIRNN